MNLHHPDLDPRRPAFDGCPDARRPVPTWMLAAVIAAVLGGALVATALTTDTRTSVQRHLFVPTGARAL